MKLKMKLILWIFFIAIITTWIYSNSIDSKTDVQSQKIKIELLISEFDTKTKSLIEKIKSSTDKDFFSLNSTIKEFNNRESIERIDFFIYENDSLIYWSSNRTYPPKITIENYSGIYHSGNGWYRFIKINENPFSYLGVYLIKNDFNYQNQYLQNSFNPSFNLPDDTKISLLESDNISISDTDGNILFSLSPPINKSPGDAQLNILATLYFLTIILMLLLITKTFLIINGRFKTSIFSLLSVFFVYVLIRYLIFLFPFSSILNKSKIFMPYYYGYSDLIPSLGDLFINSVFLLFISISIYSHLTTYFKKMIGGGLSGNILSISLLLLSFFLFEIVNFVIKSLVFDSRIPMDLNNIFNLTLVSLFSYLIISITLVGYLLISFSIIKLSFSSTKRRNFSLTILSFTIYAILLQIFGIPLKLNHFLILTYVLFLGYYNIGTHLSFDLTKIIVVTIIFSILSTNSLYEYNTSREREHRKLIAVSLSSEQRDPVSEFLFQSESDKIFNDHNINKTLNKYSTDTFDYVLFERYFHDNFFNGHWNKFDVQVTICTEIDILNIQPENIEVSCITYFEDLIATSTVPTESPELFFVNYGPGENGYIALLNFSNALSEVSELKLFVELFPKISTQKLGFPDLLVDNSVSKIPDISGYSYAKYQEGKLYKRVGPYSYNFRFEPSSDHENPYSFFSSNDYNHLLYQIDNSRFIIISLKEKSLLDILAPFSYLFMLYLLSIIIVHPIISNQDIFKKTSLSFKTRLQLSVSSVLLFSFLSIGFFTLFYINNLNNKKNEDILSEKTHSVLIEMQHKFIDLDEFEEPIRNYVADLLVKFSNVFFTDINLFDINGDLIATSRPQIFDENLISKKMQPDALNAVRFMEKSLFIQNESIGKQEYLSAYIPFTNHIGEITGFLNLPYFAKENELNREISNLLVVYINIYVILIGISVIIAIIISNYISRPLRMIIEKIKVVKLGGKNETIDLTRNDEIGELVREYNRMINELSKSAELLSKSEREYAWREMAKQVAHEIKNPLTPMKLSVQHLNRAWNDSPTDWEKRLNRFTQTMIEQIDSLSAIATEFSDFAKMPAGKKEKTDLVESINSTIILFGNYDRIKFIFNHNKNENYQVLADREQMLRVFNNLLKNAVQAIGHGVNGKIEIQLLKKQDIFEITISDNGTGIPDEISEKIFSPNFTTKTGGTGLGLAIVKSIISASAGEISYVSKIGIGTTFTILLPAI